MVFDRSEADIRKSDFTYAALEIQKEPTLLKKLGPTTSWQEKAISASSRSYQVMHLLP